MILREFTDQTSRKTYICNVCSKAIGMGITYKRHYIRGEPEAITIHPECYRKQLLKEYEWITVGKWQKDSLDWRT